MIAARWCLPAALVLLFGLKATGGVPWDPFPPGWVGGVVPYAYDDDVPNSARTSAARTMAQWAANTILEFAPRTDEADFLVLAENCRGRKPCFQISDWFAGNVHGLGHGIWLEHEQQRRDRDRYIRVFQERISPHYRWTWNPQEHYELDVGSYNYQSVMHYEMMSSKRNRRGDPPLLETIPPHMPVGQLGSFISPGDADTVARMSGLTPESWTISTNPAGLTVVVDGVELTTPAVFDWALGSTHTLSVPEPQVRSGSHYTFGRWSDRSTDEFRDTRTVVAATDTTLYEANFVAAHAISTSVRPAGAGTVTVRPDYPDGFHPLRSEVSLTAEPTAGSNYRFLRWEIGSSYYWQGLLNHEAHGEAANPAGTYATPGLTYTAVFTQDRIVRIESNADPTTVEVNGSEYRTPVAFEAGSLPSRTTVALGRDYLENDKGYRDRFRSWSDGGAASHVVSVSRTENTVLELAVDVEHRLQAEAWNEWHGNGVRATPASADGFYAEGTEVRLLASARPPALFVGWNGDVTGRSPATRVVMDRGKLVQAVFALDATELQPGVPVDVSLRWYPGDRDVGERYFVPVPPDASELEVQFSTRSATGGGEAGLFVEPQDVWPSWVRHESAQRVLRGSAVARLSIERPPERWPAAYFILVRGAEAERGGTRTLEGRLVARVLRFGDGNRLRGGQRLGSGQFLHARSDACKLVFQPDGNLVAYYNRVPYWAARTRARGGEAVMEPDGNFVVYDASGEARWSTGTGGNTGAYVGVQNDCNVVLRAANGAALWASGRP